MKVTLLLFMLYSVQLFCQDYWRQLQSGVSSFLRDISFVSIDTGWVVGHAGTILKTTNGGNTWIPQSAPTNDYLSVCFIDSYTGWIGGTNGIILRTTNGGANWMSSQFSNDDIASVWFLNKSDGFALSTYVTNQVRYVYLIKSTDGGINWYVQNGYSNYSLLDLYFREKYGWAVGTNGFMLRTTNGGTNWQYNFLPTLQWLYDVFFVNSNKGWTVGGNVNTAVILKTNDGGINWTSQLESSLYSWLHGVCFTNENEGWVCGYNGVILKTTNSGVTWQKQSSPVNYSLQKVVFPTTNVGYIVGELGTILKYNYNSNNIGVIKPNGGENIVAGTIYNIEWSSIGIIAVKIEYSTNNGVNWISIVDSTLSTGIYEWQVPNVLSSQGLVRISDKADLSNYDISNSNFNIVSSKNIRVIYPNGGEVLQGGNSIDIIWTSNEILNVKLEYSINNGASYELIAENYSSSGLYTWIVPSIATTQGRIRISDQSLPIIFDVSDTTFRINKVVSIWEDINHPEEFFILQNFPNPFNPSTKINFSLAEEAFISLDVYDMLGNLVENLILESKPSGNYSVEFTPVRLPSGVYLCRLTTPKFHQTIKMLFLQ